MPTKYLLQVGLRLIIFINLKSITVKSFGNPFITVNIEDTCSIGFNLDNSIDTVFVNNIDVRIHLKYNYHTTGSVWFPIR